MQLVKNYLYNAGYQLLTLITPFITVPYIARVLGPVGVGTNSYTNSIITYFLLIGTLGTTIYGNREIAYHRENIEERSKIFWEIEVLQVVTILVAYILFLIFLSFQKEYKMYLLLQSISIFAGVFDISWLFMGLEDFKKTVTRNTLVKIVSLISIFLFVKTASDTGIYIVILGLTNLLGNMTLWPYLKRVVVPIKLSQLHFFRHLIPSLSLFIPQVAIQVYLQLNKTMLGQLDSVVAAGYYDYADKLIKMLLAFVTATGTVMLPRISNLYAKGRIEKVKVYLYKSFDFVSFLAIPLSFGVAGIALALAPWYYGEKFSIVGILLIIEAPVIIAIGWSNVIGQQYLMPTRDTHHYTISVTFGAIINIIINIPMIIAWGVKGATISTLISEIAVTLYQLFIVRKQFNFKIMFENCGKYLLAGLIMFFVVFSLNNVMKISILSIFLQIFEGVMIYIGVLLILQPSTIDNLKVFLRN